MKIYTVMKKKDLSNIQIFRYLILAFSLFLICISCSEKMYTGASMAIEPEDPMEGVWELISYCRLTNEDTTFKSETSSEHKIYLDGYFMWNHNPDPDGSEWHGFGTYTFQDGMVTETLKTMSLPMRSHSTPAPVKIVLGEDSYEQVQVSDMNGNTYKQVWRYKRLN